MKKIILSLLFLVMCLGLLCNYSYKVNADSDVENISTHELVRKMYDSGELMLMNYYTNSNSGYRFFKRTSSFISTILMRDDAYLELVDLKKYIIDENPSSYAIKCIDTILYNEYNNILCYLDDNFGGLRSEDPYNHTYVYTPNGTAVEAGVYQGQENAMEYLTLENNVIDLQCYYSCNRLDTPSYRYNCHSYAWYGPPKPNESYWINDPINYITDNSYSLITSPRPGDILTYWNTYETTENGVTVYEYELTHSAIITNVGNNFNINNLSTLCELDVISKWAQGSLFEHNADECIYAFFDPCFSHINIYRPTIHNSYFSYQFSDVFQRSKTIASINDYAMYELNINHSKNYEMHVLSNVAISVKLYDIHMQLINYENLTGLNNDIFFSKYLEGGNIYYLRVSSLVQPADEIIITTTIKSKKSLNVSVNNIYDDVMYGDSVFSIIISNDAFYRFIVSDNSHLYNSFPANSFYVKDYSNSNLVPKYIGGSILCSNNNLDNSFIVYLEHGYYNFNFTYLQYYGTSLNVMIEQVNDSQELDYLSGSQFIDVSFSNPTTYNTSDFVKRLNIKQLCNISVNIDYIKQQNVDVIVVLFDCLDNNNIVLLKILTASVSGYSSTINLVEGEYILGCFNVSRTSTLEICFERVVTSVGYNNLMVDPASGYLCGSEINIYEMNEPIKSYNSTSIHQGFSRIIYLNPTNTNILSRLDYKWYSYDETIVTVSKYGTVFAVSPGATTVIAVLKSNPSIVYVIDFTVVAIPQNTTFVVYDTYTIQYNSMSNGYIKFNLENINCPYPLIRLYNWSIDTQCHNNSGNYYLRSDGYIHASGTGCFTLTGLYYVNNVLIVTLIIHIEII